MVKTAPQFRAGCRAAAEAILDRIRRAIEAGTIVNDADLRALEVLSDRGGYLAGDRLATAQAARGRLILEVLASDQIPADQKKQILAEWMEVETEAKTPVALPPLPPAPESQQSEQDPPDELAADTKRGDGS